MYSSISARSLTIKHTACFVVAIIVPYLSRLLFAVLHLCNPSSAPLKLKRQRAHVSVVIKKAGSNYGDPVVRVRLSLLRSILKEPLKQATRPIGMCVKIYEEPASKSS